MPARHRSRHRAVQILYQVEMRQIPAEQALAGYYDSLYSEEHKEQPEPDKFLDELVHGTLEQRAQIDPLIEKHLQNWRMERLSAVDRNILRMAAYELISKKSPPAVVIDEALDLARRFSGDDAVSLVNGVLDAISKDPEAVATEKSPG
jgi:N utilization substance protein B